MTELNAPRLACREVVELLSDHVDGALPARRRDRVEAHLRSCPECRAYLLQLRTTIGTLRRLREDDVPRPIRARLVAAFRAWRAS